MEITASDKNFLDVGCSLSGKRWLERSTNYRQAQALSQQFQFPEIIGRFLSARGVLPEFVENFLNPKLNTMLPDPSHFLDMQLGVKRIIRAIQANEKIVIFGDYDVDGATSTALLALYFSAIEVDYKIYIPDRIKEGYGPSITAFQKLKEEGASVIITVDCGTTAFEPLTFANDNGLDIIIVDHHIAEANLPKAVAVINPNRLDEIGQHTQLAAVGVSFLLTVALNRELREVGFFTKNKAVKEPNLLNFLDI